jgi:hypothetical protein
MFNMVGGVMGDSNFSLVSLLMHMSGVNNSTTFTDSSKNAFSVTANGGAKISTSSSKFGGSSGIFNGTNAYISISDNGSFDFGTGDFTIECYVNFQGTANDRASICGGIGPTNGDFMFAVDVAGNPATGAIWFGKNQVSWDASSSSQTWNFGQWYNIAVTRVSGTMYFFRDGTLLTSVANANSYGISNSNFVIGARQLNANSSVAGEFLNAYLDEMRITKGLGRYTSSYTVFPYEFQN